MVLLGGDGGYTGGGHGGLNGRFMVIKEPLMVLGGDVGGGYPGGGENEDGDMTSWNKRWRVTKPHSSCPRPSQMATPRRSS